MNFQKNLARFKLVTFDITDTLLKFKRPPAIQYAKKASDYGYRNVNQLKISENFRIHYKNMDKVHPNFGCHTNLLWNDWWKELVIEVFLSTDPSIPREDVEKIAIELIHDFSTSDCWTKLVGADDIVNKIKTHVETVGVISNFDPRIETIIETMELPKFNFIIGSYEACCKKPEKRIFEKALKLCNCQANEALHIGNTPTLDYIGSKEAGWSSILITNEKNWTKHTDINPAHVFESIPHFIKALETTSIVW